MHVEDLRREMQRGATLLVPTQRAARAWRQRLFAPAEQAELPRVLPWGAWTAAAWQSLLLQGKDDRVLLNSLQDRELWTEVLRAAEPGTLRPIRSLVRLCTAAQHLLHGYVAVGRQLAFRGEAGSDTAVFADWFRVYTQRCSTERLLSAAALEGALATHLSDDAALAPLFCDGNPVFVLGFDSLLPAQVSLLEQLTQASVAVSTIDAEQLLDVRTADSTLLRCADEHHEWTSLAQRLRRQDEAPASTAGAAMLVVLPDAESSRAALDRELRDAARNEEGFPGWEFAAGLPLATLPPVAAALSVLHWCMGALPSEVVAGLLQSPFLDLHVDRERAGELDAYELRDNRRLRPEWTLTALAHRAAGREPHLRDALLQLEATAARHLRGERTHGEWATALQTVLAEARWPGSRERGSLEFQIVDRWQDLLETLATLDLFNRRIPFAEFLADLEAAAAETLFAAENTGAPIQVVSPSEAAGITADLLWFAHATEVAWTARRAASPLLSWSLQAECGMPGTDKARDAEDHRRTTERLLRSASTVVVSYAGANADGELRPSAVFDAVPGLRLAHADAPATDDAVSLLEGFADDAPLPSLPAGVVAGGVGVLKEQAACAFRAFAERRLFSSEPETMTMGFDPRQRGELLHAVLQNFWAEVKAQSELLRLQKAGELAAVLQRHIDAALRLQTGDSWQAAYLDLQRRRLHSVLMKWFELEAQRPAFTVLHTEHEVKDVAVGPLRFNLRVDRVDSIERDGEPALALIDYKTGSPKVSDWRGPRPNEPQLPLYAVAANLENVGAIAFATVRPGDKQLGLRALPGTSELLFAGKRDHLPELFEQQMEEWYGTMVRLSEEFARGDARVGPKQYPGTCTFCGQRMLCRLNPELLEDLATEDDAAQEASE